MNLPNKKYNIIYADPAWTFKTWSSKGDVKSPKYDLMTIDDIKNMPVDDIADDNCILFIWVTYPLLKEGLSQKEYHLESTK
jgi:N6-adenosine-specific RNA methylase IME4